MKTTSTRQDQGIPGVYGLLLLDVVSRWGYNDETLFSPFRLTSEQLADPNYRIPTPIANELVKHALRLTGESTLGFHLGTQMRISIHGFIGYAIMTAHDITDAIALASRFIQLRLPFYNSIFPRLDLKPPCSCSVTSKLNLYALRLSWASASVL